MVRSGLEVLLDDPAAVLGDGRVALVCNHTAVDRRLQHAIDLLLAKGVRLVRLFGPEHGVRATAQDMETVGEQVDPVTGLPTVSLYGNDEASLHPDPSTLFDIDTVLFDIQDIGARYYTYQATLGFVMQVAGPLGKRVVVLDRPNPIDGVTVEGNMVHKGFESFVGAFPIAVRHGMTVGELGRYFVQHCGISCELDVVRCEGWRRQDWFDATGLPWVYPSPNMPTLETATIYPGMCLLEATNLSEGRGTTRPFHLVGAPWLDPQAFVKALDRSAADAGLEGVLFRPAAFVPGFQKFAGQGCTGAEVHLTDRGRLNTLLLGLVVIEAARRTAPRYFAWRAEPYEFVADVPAIDLLTGNADFRQTLESGGSLRGVMEGYEADRLAFLERRAGCLLY
ncbi:MAG: DUF1343 domain-containing protein [Alphaproteobacteria bacterium]|nr:DUF1343 domain-containing protein [Alphaproteobacteria bacterium]MCB9697383.1 DUF1343 domain-containing protein [Alphaproteobacteria bacterium]